MLPTLKDLNPDDCLDGLAAAKKFQGKDIEQAVQMFKGDFELYIEHLFWMGPKAFCFYLPAVVSYVKSESARGDESIAEDLASCLLSKEPLSVELAPAASDLRILADYVLLNWSKFLESEYREVIEYEDSREDWLKLRKQWSQ